MPRRAPRWPVLSRLCDVYYYIRCLRLRQGRGPGSWSRARRPRQPRVPPRRAPCGACKYMSTHIHDAHCDVINGRERARARARGGGRKGGRGNGETSTRTHTQNGMEGNGGRETRSGSQIHSRTRTRSCPPARTHTTTHPQAGHLVEHALPAAPQVERQV